MTNQAIEEIKVNGLQAFGEKSDDSNRELLEFIYQNDPIVNLLFNCSQGTEFESIRHDLVNLEVQGAKKLIEVLKEKKIEVNDLNDDELHVLYTMACTDRKSTRLNSSHRSEEHTSELQSLEVSRMPSSA